MYKEFIIIIVVIALIIGLDIVTNNYTKSSVSILSNIGKPKAAVLPVPVWACPITSFPSNANGIVAL